MAHAARAVYGRSRRLRRNRAGSRGHGRTFRDRPVRRRRPLGHRRSGDRGRVGPRGPRARASGQHRAPDPARAADRGELRESRAHVPLHRRGSGQCARSERRVHVVTRTLDHRPRAASRRRARPRATRAQAPRAGGALPRHRQDRHPVQDPHESRARSTKTSASSSRRIPSSASASSLPSSNSARSVSSFAARTSTTTAPGIPTTCRASRFRSSHGSCSRATPSTR